MSRKRSVVWDYFKDISNELVVCVLCKNILSKHEQGTTTMLLRHLRTQHPDEPALAAKLDGKTTAIDANFEQKPMEIGQAQVEVELKDGESDIFAPAKQDEIDSAINGILLAVQESKPVRRNLEKSDVAAIQAELPSSGESKYHSLIWKHFDHFASVNGAQCLICKKMIKCPQGRRSNLFRHMSKTHPQVNLKADETVNEANVDSEGNATPMEVSAEIVEESQANVQHAHVENSLQSKMKYQRRSSVWKHFRPLDNLDGAQCWICNKKLKCPDGKTSNLHRHMAKRHPEVQRPGHKALQQTKPNLSSHTSNVGLETCPVEVTDNRAIPGVNCEETSVSVAERRIYRRERELIEALRRTQKEEAKALQDQRQLLQSLRAVNAREAAAEKKEIESLRRAQQEEAEELKRQREELERERAEQQKKWEKFEKEQTQLLLLPK
ncbi:uncharacterized protein LOC144070706 [Stigmatopora argus]